MSQTTTTPEPCAVCGGHRVLASLTGYPVNCPACKDDPAPTYGCRACDRDPDGCARCRPRPALLNPGADCPVCGADRLRERREVDKLVAALVCWLEEPGSVGLQVGLAQALAAADGSHAGDRLKQVQRVAGRRAA